MKLCHVLRLPAAAVLFPLASLTQQALAFDFKLDNGVEGALNVTATIGTMLRTEAPDPNLYGALGGPLVGAAPGLLNNYGNSSDLNFEKNKPVSTVIKGMADLRLQREKAGIFLRLMAWNDFELKGGDRPYGSIVNGFKQNSPLSDQGFDKEARFSNAIVSDAYFFGQSDLGNGSNLSGRIGRQRLNWGVAQFVAGGINVINPGNNAGQQRPGSLPEESRLPVGMVYGNLDVGKQWGAEVFVQYEFQPTAQAGCGTFFVTANFLPTGCGFVNVLASAANTDAKMLAAGTYLHRDADKLARDSGQFGVSLRYSAESIMTEIRGYAMNYHSRTPSMTGVNANVGGTYGLLTGTVSRLTDPNGQKYGLMYAEDIKLFGLSFDTKLDRSLRLYGELAYRPNQPLNMNASDLTAAFLQRQATSLLNLSNKVLLIPPGGTFEGYDRYRVTNLDLGISKAFENALGAQSVTLTGEIGVSQVGDLPDPATMRYGRGDIYGVAYYNGQAPTFVCATTPTTWTAQVQKQCSLDGFITSTSSGVRLRIAANYPGALFGATLTPSLLVAKDLNGTSYDGSFLQGRTTVIAALRADWNRKYYADLQYTRFDGGDYFTQSDRDNLALVFGMRF